MATAHAGADEQVVKHLSSAICLRDDDTGRHIEQVSLTAAALADWYGFVADPAPAIRLAAAMHDVGKIGIPDWVLLKPGRLNAAETAIIQRHCELGYALLSGSPSPVLTLAASVALNHHERWDGCGYPRQRKGNDIPLEARITSVADVFDALTRDRVYRSALPVDTAVDVMVRERGGLFEPALLDLFLDRLDDVLAIAAALRCPAGERLIRVLLVDGERLSHDNMAPALEGNDEVCVVGTAHTVAEAIDAVHTLRPDVLISGSRMGDGDGVALATRVRDDYPETKVIIVARASTPEIALRCVIAGSSAILAADAGPDEVAEAIRRVHRGAVVIPPPLLRRVGAVLRRPCQPLAMQTTAADRELLGHIASGLSLPDTAVAMSTTVNHARQHMERVIAKVGARSKLEAVVIATQQGIVETATGAEDSAWSGEGHDGLSDKEPTEPPARIEASS